MWKPETYCNPGNKYLKTRFGSHPRVNTDCRANNRQDDFCNQDNRRWNLFRVSERPPTPANQKQNDCCRCEPDCIFWFRVELCVVFSRIFWSLFTNSEHKHVKKNQRGSKQKNWVEKTERNNNRYDYSANQQVFDSELQGFQPDNDQDDRMG